MEKFKKAVRNTADFLKAHLTYTAPLVSGFVIVSFIVTVVGVEALALTRGAFTDPMTYVQLLLHQLIHSESSHFFINAAILLLVGTTLEERYGMKWTAIMMTVTTLVSGGLFLLLSRGETVLAGGLGIVFMMVLLSTFSNLLKGKVPVSLLLFLAIFIWHYFDSGQPGLAFVTQIVGGFFGAIAGYFFNKGKLYPEAG